MLHTMVNIWVSMVVVAGFVAGLCIGWRLASSRAPREHAADFLALADARLAPVRDALGAVDAQLRAVEATRAQAYGGLMEQVGALRAEAGQLVSALRAPQTRGRWGEMTLRRVVEAAGAIEHCHFSEQVTTVGESGTQRPDMVVHLADGKQVVIDSKVPFVSYLEAMEARDDTSRTHQLRAHARALRAHVKALGDKSYWQALEDTPEFVVLFVPADVFLDAALAQDPALLDDAFTRNVVIATPSTLVALLRTVAYCWRSERLSANAAQISSVGRDLYARLATMGGHVDRLGGALSKAVRAYNETVGSLETRVLVSARLLNDLDVSTELLPAPTGVPDAPRHLVAPELTRAS